MTRLLERPNRMVVIAPLLLGIALWLQFGVCYQGDYRSSPKR